MAESGVGGACVRLVLGAFATEDYIGVKHAIVDADGVLTGRVAALADACKELSLVRVVAYGGPAAWLPSWVEEESRFNHATIEVSEDGLWFEDQPKHGNCCVQTRWISIAQLNELRELHAGTTICFEEGEVRVLGEHLMSDEEVEAALQAEEEQG
jgi:hypothetical protein